MATIAQSRALASALEADTLLGPQIWLDVEHGLVGGIFPVPVAKFDFALEAVVAFSENQDSQAASVTPKKFTSLLTEARRISRICEIETPTSIYRLGSTTQMLIVGLDLIETMRPGTLEKLSKIKKQSKRPVAKNRDDLYDTPHPLIHSMKLKSGWFVATNNKAIEARGVLRKAISLSDLRWGVDFITRYV
ncbi:MAG: hypothetical protein JWM33_2519 [Caulobacteraceae bacterium]|nr:hypothetical protein [Caulobacteraceae bacterium]